jgi:hypothetical protein
MTSYMSRMTRVILKNVRCPRYCVYCSMLWKGSIVGARVLSSLVGKATRISRRSKSVARKPYWKIHPAIIDDCMWRKVGQSQFNLG